MFRWMFLFAVLSQEDDAGIKIGELIANYRTSILTHQRAFACEELIVTSYGGAYDFEGVPITREVRVRSLRRAGDFDFRLTDVQYYAKDPADVNSELYSQRDQLRVISLQAGSEHGFNLLAHQKGSQVGSDHVSVSTDYERTKLAPLYVLGPSAILDGYFSGDLGQSIPDILESQSSAVTSELDHLDGEPVFRVEAEGLFGIYKVWLDPDRGFNPRQIQIRKRSKDFYNGQDLGTEPPALPDGAFPKEPWVSKVEYVVDVYDIDIEYIEGEWIIVGAIIDEATTFDTGDVTLSTTEHARTNISVEPDSYGEGAFTLDAPNGTPARIADLGHSDDIRFQWMNGKLVPAFDIEEIRQIDLQIDTLKQLNFTVPEGSEDRETSKPQEIEQQEDMKKPHFYYLYGIILLVSVLGATVTVYRKRK